jgi:hypothetical protein
MSWVTYQGHITGGRVILPPTIRLPEKATVLVTVLAGEIPGDLQPGTVARSQQAVLDEARTGRARLTAAGAQTQSVDALDEVRTERLNDFADLR